MEDLVRRPGDRIRINVQLIDAATDEHLCAETYDRELSAENVFSIEGLGTVVTGKVEQGTVRPGDPVEIVGRNRTRRVIDVTVGHGVAERM